MIDKCPICLEELVSNIGVAVPCGHCFHRDCYARLKEDSEQRAEVMELPLQQRCCLCKKKVSCSRPVAWVAHLKSSFLTLSLKVRKFHNLFLSFDSIKLSSTTREQNDREKLLWEKGKELEKRIIELQSLSADQSDILCRLVPRHDHLEARYSKLKQEKEQLKRQLKVVEDENWDLRFDCFDATAKLERARAHRDILECRLEEAEGENRDLQVIGKSLEQQLISAKLKRKAVKTKMKHLLREHCQQIDVVKHEMESMKQEKDALQGELKVYRRETAEIKEMRLVAKKRKRTKNKRGKKLSLNLIV
jgi:chromosome segregation ATPase